MKLLFSPKLKNIITNFLFSSVMIPHLKYIRFLWMIVVKQVKDIA